MRSKLSAKRRGFLNCSLPESPILVHDFARTGQFRRFHEGLPATLRPRIFNHRRDSSIVALPGPVCKVFLRQLRRHRPGPIHLPAQAAIHSSNSTHRPQPFRTHDPRRLRRCTPRPANELARQGERSSFAPATNKTPPSPRHRQLDGKHGAKAGACALSNNFPYSLKHGLPG